MKSAIAKGLSQNFSGNKQLLYFFRFVMRSAFEEEERIGSNLKGQNNKKTNDGEKLDDFINNRSIQKNFQIYLFSYIYIIFNNILCHVSEIWRLH